MNEEERHFLYFLRCGLWNLRESYDGSSEIRWDRIYDLALQQTVAGVIADGITMAGIPIPTNEAAFGKFAGTVFATERRNTQMDALVVKIFRAFSENGIKAFLVKGQEAARAYPDPSKRQPGDIDIFMDAGNYMKAKSLVALISGCGGIERESNLHYATELGDVEVELHGSFKSLTDRNLDKRVIVWAEEMTDFPCPVWKEGGTEIGLLPYNFEAIFLFLHFFHHFMTSGLGLRQICDWVRYLYVNKDNIDRVRLEKDISRLGIVLPWRVFACLAVDYLGCPEDSALLYDDSYSRKALKVLERIMKTGNFGKSVRGKRRNERYLVRKTRSFFISFKDFIRLSLIFPKESLLNFSGFCREGMGAVMNDIKN
jgi:hypothetical protein